MELFIGCSSSEYISDEYLIDCKNFLEEFFSCSNNLVFGVCSKGIMGLSHDIALKHNRKITGICPELYMEQFDDVKCTDSKVTKTVGERTKGVIDVSDVLLFLPGGIGTVYELFSAIEWKRSLEFDKPIIIYNSCGYFDKLLEFMDLIYDNGFTSREIEKCYYVCDNAIDAINYINKYYEEIMVKNYMVKKIKKNAKK